MVTKRLSFTSTNIYYHFIIDTRVDAIQNRGEARHMNIVDFQRVLNNSTKMFSNTTKNRRSLFSMYNKMTKLFLRVKTIASENSKKYCHRFSWNISPEAHRSWMLSYFLFCIEGFFYSTINFHQAKFVLRTSFFSDNVFNSNSSVNINFWITVIWQFNNQNK